MTSRIITFPGVGDNWLLVTGGGAIDFHPGLETIINEGRRRRVKILASGDGWAGVSLPSGEIFDVTNYPTDILQHFGGSIIGSGRTKIRDMQVVADKRRKHKIGTIIPFGGGDTLKEALRVYNELGIPVVGWPKTMDNDNQGSYSTVGYQKAIERASRHTREAFDTAYAHSRIVLVIVYGRNYDWVSGGAADYGQADYIITAERKGFNFSQAAQDIKEIYFRNKEAYGKPFAVVVVSEAAWDLDGLDERIRRIVPSDQMEYDDFGHPKYNTDILSYVLRKALSEETGIKLDKISTKHLTYHLRDGKLPDLDDKFARATAEECVRLIDQGNFGRVATIQDPSFSGFWPSEEWRYIKANDYPLIVFNVPLELAAQDKSVSGTGFLNYGDSKPTEQFSRFLYPLLGPKPVNPRDKIVPLRLAVPAGLDLRVEAAESDQRASL